MNGQRTRLAIRCLHWTVGLVILLEASRTFHVAHSGSHDLGHAGALASARLLLSGAEIPAALLFLVPFTTLVGGYALLGIIALAIAIHSLHGDFAGLEILVLYGMAVFVTLAYRKESALAKDDGRALM